MSTRHSLYFIAMCGLLAIPAPGGTWTEVAPMNVTRQYPGLARLPDGRVLAVTGHPLGGQSIASAEIYDPKKDTWTPTGPLNLPRNGVEPGGLIVLMNGKVLIAGGGTSARSANEAELYDPATGRWSGTGPLNEARSNHSTTLLKDGRVLVAGGIDWATDSPRSTAEIFDPESAVWALTGPLATRRMNHSAALLKDGRVLVIGGASESDVAGELSSAEIYDPATGKFRATSPMHTERRAFGAVLLRDGRVLVVGGAQPSEGGANNQTDRAEIFNPSDETWTEVGPLLEARWGPSATLLPGGKVLVTGGMFGRADRRQSAEIFDTATGTWSSAGMLKQARNGHRAIALDDGKVLIAGGFSGLRFLVSCEIFAE